MPYLDTSKTIHSKLETITKNTFIMRRNNNDSIYRSRANSTSGIAESEHSVEAYLIRSKKAAGYLRQILHSQKCGGMCQLMSCIQTTRVLAHTGHCDVAICATQGCETTKKLLLHFQQCRFSQGHRGLSHGSSSSGAFGGINPSTCLVCSIACSSSPTKSLMPHHRHSSIINSNNELHHRMATEEEEILREEEQDTSHVDQSQDFSFSSDEVIQFNRIPFQNNQVEAARVRPQAYSADGFAIPTGAPRGNKARSKSMNAMSVDEFAAI